MNQTLSSPPSAKADDRWTFLRDVAVFQLKLLVDNVRDFLLMPVSLGAALIDLVSKGEREGALFYKVLQWGSHSEQIIDVYSAINPSSPRSRESSARQEGPGDGSEEPGKFQVNPNYTIDAVIARLESVLVREIEKGGTAASIKAAMNRAIDQLHTETSGTRDKATGLVARARDKLRSKFDKQDREE